MTKITNGHLKDTEELQDEIQGLKARIGGLELELESIVTRIKDCETDKELNF